MQLIGIFRIFQRNYKSFPWPFPCLEQLLQMCDKPGSCCITFPHDIEPLDASKIGFFERAYHLYTGQTEGWQVMVPQRPAIGFALHEDEVARLPGLVQTLQPL